MSDLITTKDGKMGLAVGNRLGAPYHKHHVYPAPNPDKYVLVVLKKTAPNTYEPCKTFSADDIYNALVKTGKLNPEILWDESV